MGDIEINGVAFAPFVDSSGRGIFLWQCVQNPLLQKECVGLGQPQRSKEDSGFMFARDIIRGQALIAQLGNVDDGVFPVRHPHHSSHPHQ